NESFKVVLKTKIYPDDNNSYSANCDNWVRKYSEHTKTNWIVYKTHPNYKKFEYRKEYVCQHSVKNKSIHAESNATRITFENTHRIHVAETYSFLRVSKSVQNNFKQYFSEGMTPAGAKQMHEVQLISAEESMDVAKILANAQCNPTERQFYMMYDTWR
ncbi:protein ALP1-like, partial [Aphis craccivora]